MSELTTAALDQRIKECRKKAKKAQALAKEVRETVEAMDLLPPAGLDRDGRMHDDLRFFHFEEAMMEAHGAWGIVLDLARTKRGLRRPDADRR